MKYYIVWNADKTLGFITTDQQIAYEARKGSDTNCYNSDDSICLTAIAFIEDTADETCSIEIVEK